MKRTMLIALSVLLAFTACSKPKPKKEPRIELVTVVTLHNGNEIEVNKLRYPTGIFSNTFELRTDFGIVEVPENFAGVDTVKFLYVKSYKQLADEANDQPVPPNMTRAAQRLIQVKAVEPGVKLRITFDSDRVVEGIEKDHDPTEDTLKADTNFGQIEIKLVNIKSIERRVKGL